MRDTIYCEIPADADQAKIAASITEMVADVATYVPGYRLPDGSSVRRGDRGRGVQRHRVAIFLEVEGRGDFLPAYAGNLDIMTAAATQVGAQIVRHRARSTAGALR